MSKDIIIPSLGESISEVVISALLVDTGSFVQENQGILEIESEKVNQVVYSPASGIIHWKIKVGDVVSVGSSIGSVKVQEEDVIFYKKNIESSKNSLSEEFQETSAILKKKDYRGEIIEFPGSLSPDANKAFTSLKHPLSYESIQKEKKISFPQDNEEERRPMSTLRKTISKRLVKSLKESAMLTTFNEINMDVVIDLKHKYKETLFKETQVKLGFMSFFISAVTQALKEFPILNSYIDEDNIVYRKYYNIGVAVSTDKGLVVPVIRNCEKFSLIELEKELITLANKARSGLLSMEDLSQGGFTITNAGVFGSLLSTPIINPPQVGILGIHKIEKRPIVINNNEIKIAQMMYVALSYDHRIIDGKDAVSFLVRIKEIIENPNNLSIT